ncbi:MAG: primase-helicase family protein, partial [Sedimentitalea sp.]
MFQKFTNWFSPKPEPVPDIKVQQAQVAGKRPVPKPKPESVSEKDKALLCQQLAQWYVRKDNKFLLVDRPDNTISRADIERASLLRIKKDHPTIALSPELLKEVFQHAIEAKHSDATQSIQVWNGHFSCRPNIAERLIPEDGFVTINSWRTPTYRTLGETAADCSLIDDFMAAAFPHPQDAVVAKNWLAWCLQNESKKPGWALFLYSRKKGTGKSTFCQFASRLFGERNAFTQNSVEKLVSKFNMPILQSKLIISEELMLKTGSTQGNTLKTYITEEQTASEIKGREVQPVRQCCCFLFTSNHMPIWIESDDRCYYIIDVDHQGHAS